MSELMKDLRPKILKTDESSKCYLVFNGELKTHQPTNFLFASTSFESIEDYVQQQYALDSLNKCLIAYKVVGYGLDFIVVQLLGELIYDDEDNEVVFHTPRTDHVKLVIYNEILVTQFFAGRGYSYAVDYSTIPQPSEFKQINSFPWVLAFCGPKVRCANQESYCAYALSENCDIKCLH